MSSSMRPIVIVTGANGGVGYGICQRLLVQLCEETPSDSLPQAFEEVIKDSTRFPPGLTLIMACRSPKRAEKARTDLHRFFERHVAKLRSQPGYTGRAEELQKYLTVNVETLDLASIRSVIAFASVVKAKYPYVSHLACNAGLASFKSIDWFLALKQFLTEPVQACTAPNYYTQHQGELSADFLGFVWQCNVFSHFALFRELESSFAKAPEGGRVIWCSSLEARPNFYDPEDWQLRKTEHSYESSKYQIDIIATALDRKALARKGAQTVTRHFVSQPGVSSTSVAAAIAGPILDWLKVLSFYFARLCGSQHHPISPFKGAIAVVHLMLVPLTCLAYLTQPNGPPVRFGSETDRWGNERVGLTPVTSWLKHQDEADSLIQKCDKLLDDLKNEASRPLEFETASEKM
ncbi:3-keto sterol reductase [Coprinopsis marcescibilis]|uniref:3-keto sterol reductase n=1 Tax=Coprinopsis marcescibilis TaxID=230819 RepID=A0A5C3L6N7_COPMA|nr:3-keto sterol reductase [Coprinopsis marcescibilis]